MNEVAVAVQDASARNRQIRDKFMDLDVMHYCPLDGSVGDCLHFDGNGIVHIALHIFDRGVTSRWTDDEFATVEAALSLDPFSTPEVVAALMALIRP